jgi:tRNA threonylcarbamoyl adenosine modification protein YjeE
MPAPATDDRSFTLEVARESEVLPLAGILAMTLQPGDVVALVGDLGAGKTTFARALIRELTGNPDQEAPSPTFTFLQTYESARFPIVHADLYRLADGSELAELGFDELPEGSVLLIEWPERAPELLPENYWEIAFEVSPQQGEEYRKITITGHGMKSAPLERMIAARRFLEEAGYGAAEREHMMGDASSRSYERLKLNGQSFILMNSPRRPDGPPVKDGKPYSAIAHLAEDIKPFVAISRALHDKGFSTPAIYAADLDEGFIILEDLGDSPVVQGDPPAPVKVCYEAAVHVLIALHKQILPDLLPVAPHVDYRLPAYDLDAFLIEVELLPEWYLPFRNREISQEARAEYMALWRDLLMPASTAHETWVLRDFHSPNLIWLPQRRGIACMGILDFQDAVIGPAAYDLASLLQDARVDVPEAWEMEMLSMYIRARKIDDPAFDMARFALLYATMAAQRASKILGIFARLDKRDGKPQYLRHLPRVWAYLQRALAHPALAPLADWYKVNVPPPHGVEAVFRP